jgi:hypothetical protein
MYTVQSDENSLVAGLVTRKLNMFIQRNRI